MLSEWRRWPYPCKEETGLQPVNLESMNLWYDTGSNRIEFWGFGQNDKSFLIVLVVLLWTGKFWCLFVMPCVNMISKLIVACIQQTPLKFKTGVIVGYGKQQSDLIIIIVLTTSPFTRWPKKAMLWIYVKFQLVPLLVENLTETTTVWGLGI